MANPTTNLSVTLPVVGGSDDAWGGILNAAFQSFDDIFVAGGTAVSMNIDGGTIDGTVIGGSSAAAGSFTTVVASTSVTVGSTGVVSSGDTDTSVNFPAADTIYLTAGGTNVVDVTSTACDVTGAFSASGAAVFSSSVEIDGALNHDGTTAGFFSATPVTQQAALTTEDATSPNSGDATTDTIISNIRTRLGELEQRMVNYGLIAS